NYVSSWRKQGYTDDPRKQRFENYKTLEFKDITGFYKKNTAEKSLIITVAGDKKSMNFKEVEKFGKVIEVKKKDIFRK
ncbi:MAG: hypothetical protein HY738_08920, partial [Bacteroidia bacterium]|nr:hypothetical protein [Bacteroidia bacterium]